MFKKLEKHVLKITHRIAGEDVTYTRANGDTFDIKGVFDNAWVDLAGLSSLRPTLRITLSDLPSSPMKGDSVTISTVLYRVVDSQPDGYGGSTLILRKD